MRTKMSAKRLDRFIPGSGGSLVEEATLTDFDANLPKRVFRHSPLRTYRLYVLPPGLREGDVPVS